MNKYTFTSHGRRTFTRVSKTTAKKAYINGFVIALCPCKLRPGTPWDSETIVDRETRGCVTDDISAENDFEKLLNAFEYYNLNRDTGSYTAFFIESDLDYIHFTFSDGSNPYAFYGYPVECLKELDRWKNRYIVKYQGQHNYTLTEKGKQL